MAGSTSSGLAIAFVAASELGLRRIAAWRTHGHNHSVAQIVLPTTVQKLNELKRQQRMLDLPMRYRSPLSAGLRPSGHCDEPTFEAMAQPLFTIAIPTRNRASLLRNAVASALAQTYRDTEILVSNNASTDDTSEVLKAFNDPRVRELKSDTNIGLIANWNKCIEEARGKYIVIMSDDNSLAPGFLEKCAELLERDPTLPIVVGAFDVVMQIEHRTIPACLSKRLGTGIWNGADILLEHFRGNLSFGTLSAAIRADDFRKMGGFPADLPGGGEDLILSRMLLMGRAGLINEQCASHIFHNHPTGRHSATLGLDDRFQEHYDEVQEVVRIALPLLPDAQARRDLENESRTYLWYCAMQELAFARSEGARLLDVIPHFWSWREQLMQGGPGNMVRGLRLRSLGRILLPAALIRLLRS